MEAEITVATGHDQCPTSTPAKPSLPVSMEAESTMVTGGDQCQTSKPPKAPLAPVSMEAETTVATGHDQCPTSMPPKPPLPFMDYRLLALACSGSFHDLESLLDGKDREAPSDGSDGSSADDEEAFLSESLLSGVTVGGDTALHLVATYGNSEDSSRKASLIYSKDESLLVTQNNNGDTPLHCAARASNSQMVSFLIHFAGQGNNDTRVKALLETENKSKGTVLHDAVRRGEIHLVRFLMAKNPQLASIPKDGTSPLYLAVLLGYKVIAETLHEKSSGVLSYSGPNGQNALHAAVQRNKDLTEMLLRWNKALTIQQDENGSTPLHLAASLPQNIYYNRAVQRSIRLLLLEANPKSLYQPDHKGSFPIHVAASVDATFAVSEFIENSPKCAGLRDASGRTFLHVAVDKKKVRTVGSACRNRSLSWILNTQDKDGNTALHLAVRAEKLGMFCSLFGNRQVHLSLTNGKGETPRDIARFNRTKGSLNFNQNSEVKIHSVLQIANAQSGICRRDYFEENYITKNRLDEKLEVEKLKDLTQNLCIGSALIATVTFGATFAMPGGYRADDHTNGGTPTLAGRYDFDAFTVANGLAFTFSEIATTALMTSGSPSHNTRIRIFHVYAAYYCMEISVKCLVAAFAVGTYAMLAPVAHKTAVAACVMSSLVLLYLELELILKHLFLVPSLCVRKGIVFTFLRFVYFIVGNALLKYWPIIVIFCSTIRNYPAGKV